MQRNPQNPKNLNYDPVVREQINILEEVFSELGVSGLFENKDITFDENLVLEHYLKFNLHRQSRNAVELDFHLQHGMSIDFQGLPESVEFSKDDVLNNPAKIKEVLVPLLSSPILVEYKGSAQFVNLFNHDGSRFAIWTLQSFLTLITGGYWKSQSVDQHLFEPIYPIDAK